MENDLLQFMENVLIDEKNDDVYIVIDIANMIKENDNIVIQINFRDTILKQIKFGKEVQNEKDK